MKKLLAIAFAALLACNAYAQTIVGFTNQNTGMPFVEGSTLILGQTITITANTDANTLSVVFSKDGVLMKTDVTGPYSFTWTPPLTGEHILAARPWNATTSGPAVLVHYNVIASSPTPTATPTPTGTPLPTATATPTATSTPTTTPSPSPTITPSATPSTTPTASPTPTPTNSPTPVPTPTPTPIGGPTAIVTFKWDGTADTLWYGARSEAVVQNYTGVICAPATTCTGTAFPLSHSLVLPVGVQTVKVSFATGQHYYVVVSVKSTVTNTDVISNMIEFDL